MVNVLGAVIGGLLVAVMLGALMPGIADNLIGFNESGSNITGATATLARLVPLILVIVTIVGILAVVGLRITSRI